MYFIAKDGKLELGRNVEPGKDLIHVGWVTPSRVYKPRWWFFRLRLRNGFGLMILGLHFTWWKYSKKAGK